MKITSYIVLVVAALVFVGCQKQDDAGTTPPPADTNAAPATNAPAQ